jgi:D-alanyl-D-alanine carboxypeptidase (penicillin-binding protein 5/6)
MRPVKKYIKMIPYFAILLLFVAVQFIHLNHNYERLLNSTGLVNEDFGKKLSQEKDNTIVEEQEYLNNKKDLKLHAVATLLLDASNNRVLYEENGYKELPMASTTKIMTCIVALENSKPEEIVTVSSYAAKMPDVQLNIKPGEKYYMKDLLYSLMLESHNDVAVAIAEHVGGSVEGFATMMNDKARSLGCEHTNFITPNGLDAKGHYTTARDLAVITSYAIKNEKFIEITNTPSYEFKEINNARSCHVSNRDRFLSMMEGAIGVKTGFTNGAGYCFVGAVKKVDRTLISVVLGCGWPPKKSLKWMDTKELMSYGIEYYERKQIFEEKELSPVFINNGQLKYAPLDMKGDLTLLIRADEKVRIDYDIPKVLQAPVKEKSIVGYAKYYIDNEFYDEIPVYTTAEVKKIDLKFCFVKLLQFWCQQY